MADVSDVQSALLALVSGTLFAPGYAYGAPTVSLLGPTIRLYEGWPNPSDLDADLLAGNAHVTVFTCPGLASLKTRFEKVWWTPVPPITPTLTVAVEGQTAAFSGTTAPSQTAGIQLGQNAPVAYRVTSTDTPATVAVALAALLPWASPTVAGSVITFPSTIRNIKAKVGNDVTSLLEVRRQEQVFKITVWAPNPTVRTQIASAIDLTLANTRNLTFPDTTVSNIPLCRGTYIDDVPQRAHEWRRDLDYAIEYPTVLSQTQTPVLFPYANVNGSASQHIINNPVIPTDDDILLTESENFLTLIAGEHIQLDAGQ